MVKRVMGPTVKDSPPSSPQLEDVGISISGKRKRKSPTDNIVPITQRNMQQSNNPISTPPLQVKEDKDIKIFQNNVNAPHMLGNQLNPSSTMAQKMSETLSQELEAHSIFDGGNSGANLVGPPLYNRVIETAKMNSNSASTSNFSSLLSNNNGANSMLGNGAIPQSLDQLLERQWEQGSQFLMEQAQHFDIASLLSCLHQLRAENLRLEEHVNNLLQRRDHLLAVNARLAIPLTPTSNTLTPTHTPNNIHPNINAVQGNISNSEIQNAPSNMPKTSRDSRVNNSYMIHTSAHGSTHGGAHTGPHTSQHPSGTHGATHPSTHVNTHGAPHSGNHGGGHASGHGSTHGGAHTNTHVTSHGSSHGSHGSSNTHPNVTDKVSLQTNISAEQIARNQYNQRSSTSNPQQNSNMRY